MDKITKHFTCLVTRGLIPPPSKILPQHEQPANTARRKPKALPWELWQAKQQAKQADDANFANIIQEFKTSVLDSGATANYNKEMDGLPITGPSHKTVDIAFGQTGNTSHQAVLPMTQHSDDARRTDILPVLATNSLLSIKVLSDNGDTTIFHPHDRGSEVFASDAFDLLIWGKLLLAGYCDGNGLWRVLLVVNEIAEESVMFINNKGFHDGVIHNVYELPSTEQAI